MVQIDDVTWLALGLVLSTLGMVLSYVAYRRRGVAAGLRGAAWSLLPLAAGLSGTLQLAAGIVDDTVDWAMRLVFSPTVWLGIALAGTSAVLFVVSGILRRRGIGTAPGEPGKRQQDALPSRTQQSAPPVDDDLADIEAILRKHGIQ